MATLQTRCELVDDVLFRELEGEMVVLNPVLGTYFSMNPTGTAVWRALASGASVADACDSLEREFAVPRAQITQDVIAFVDEVLANELLRGRIDQGS